MDPANPVDPEAAANGPAGQVPPQAADNPPPIANPRAQPNGETHAVAMAVRREPPPQHLRPPPPPEPPFNPGLLLMAPRPAIFVQEMPVPQMLYMLQEEPSVCMQVGGAAILVLLFALGVGLFVWNWLHPIPPYVHVATATLAAVRISGTAASGICNATFMMSNNHLLSTVIVDQMKISLIYPSRPVMLSEYHPLPFVQTSRNHTVIEADLSFTRVDLGREAATAMKQDIDRGSLKLGVKILAAVRFRNGGLRAMAWDMKSYCDGVTFRFTAGVTQGIVQNSILECEVSLIRK